MYSKAIHCFVVLMTLSTTLLSQNFSLGLSSGFSLYQGDLLHSGATFSQANPVLGFNLQVYPVRQVSFKLGFNFTKLSADDAINPRADLRARNLSFNTNLQEAFFAIQLDLINQEWFAATPYFFVGGAIFHYNPYTYDQSGDKFYLQPLHTEGQGMPNSGLSEYKLTQFAIPLGLGVKYQVSKTFFVSVELTGRKTFTDYLDDVSSRYYADPNQLREYAGDKSVELSFRGDEINPNAEYPDRNAVRGDPNRKDWYYFSTINFGFSIDRFYNSLFNPHYHKIKRGRMKCPKF